jgi:hypothetical protein
MALANTLSRTVRFLGAGPRNRVVLDPGVQLAISIELREQDQWCWAAVARGVQLAYGDNPAESQCEVATRVKGTTCCPAGDYGVCDQPHDLEDALAGHGQHPTQNKTFDFIKDCIDDGCPPAIRLGYNNAAAGHFVVISGYYTEAGLNYIWVCDPATGLEDDYEFEAFKLTDPNGGLWDKTYRTTGEQRVPVR